MTKVSRFLITFAAALALVVGMAPGASADTGPSVVYLDGVAGNDKASGESADAAVKTLTRAVKLVADDDGGRVVIVNNDYALKSNLIEPAHKGKIEISSQGGKKLRFEGEFTTYGLGGPTTFKDLTVSTSQWAVFAANFHPIVFDKGFETVSTPTPGVRQVFVTGGNHAPAADAPTDLDSNITINSGTFYKVVGFSRARGAATQTYTGTSHITLNGGVVQEIFGASVESHYSGSTEITMTGGRVGTLHTAGDATRYLTGTAKVSLTGGNVNLIDINNTVHDVDLTLAGTTFGDLRANQAFASLDREAEIYDVAPTRTVHYAAQHYSQQQIDKLRQNFDVLDNIAKVYVRAGGSGTDCTETKPCASPEAAVARLASDGGTVSIGGAATWDVDPATLAKGRGRVSFAGEPDASLSFPDGKVVPLARDTTFSDLKLDNAGSLEFAVDGKDLVMDRGVTTAKAEGVSVVGTGDGSAITIRGGDYAKVVGIAGLAGNFDGATTVTIDGGTVADVWSGTDQDFDVKASTTTVSGGTVGVLHSSKGRTTGPIALRLLGGAAKDVRLDRAAGDVSLRVGTTKVDKMSTADWTAAPDAERVLIQLPQARRGLVSQLRDDPFTEVRQDRFVYLADGGTGDGVSPSHPLGDLDQAVKALGGGEGHIVLTGPYTVDSDHDVVAHNRRIAITGHDGDVDFAKTSGSGDGAALSLEAALRSGGQLTVENLTVESPSTKGALYGMGKGLTIGQGVVTELTRRGQTYIALIGGRHDAQPTKENAISVGSGEWTSLRGGTSSSDADVTGTRTSVKVDGGIFNGPVALAPRGKGAGKVEATLTGGTFRQGVFAVFEEDGAPYAADYDVDVTVNGGEYWGMIAPAKTRTTTLAGSFDVTVAGGDFGHLTDLRGTEVYDGTMTSKLTVDPSIDIDAAPKGDLEFTNPLVRAADPYMFTKDGMYYFVSTSGSSMKLHKVANPADLGHSDGVTVFAPERLKNLWSPEIHHLTAEDVGEENAGWYLYLSAADPDDGAAEGQRQYVLKALDDDLLGRWGNPVTGKVNEPILLTNVDDPDFNGDHFVAGTSIMRVGGQTNIMYVAEEGRGGPGFFQTINMSHMKNPWTLSGKPTVVTKSEYDWEEQGYGPTADPKVWHPKVVEGATAVYGDNGEVFMAYSGSGYWTVHYAIGFLRWNGGDPFDAKSWVKNPTPIMSKNDEVNATGTGPTFTDHEGRKWFNFQARPGTTSAGARYSFIEPYTASGDKMTIGDGQPAPLDTKYTMSINPVSLAKKVSGFAA